jgi:hypothetical protein
MTDLSRSTEASVPEPKAESPQENVNAEEFNRFAAQGDVSLLLEIFEHHLGRGLTRYTWNGLYIAVGHLTSYPLLGTVVWAAQASEPSVQKVLAEEGLSEAAAKLVLKLVVLYGARIQRAVYLSPVALHDGDDWRSIHSEVLLDPASDEYRIRVEIIKKNFEKMVIRGDARSMARLARQILKIVVSVGDRSAFPSEDADSLLQMLEDACAVLRDRADPPRTAEERGAGPSPQLQAPR